MGPTSNPADRPLTVHFMALGTRGDVQPFLYAARKLLAVARERGLALRVVIVAYAAFVPWLEREARGGDWEVRAISQCLRSMLVSAHPAIADGNSQAAIAQMFNAEQRTALFREGLAHTHDTDLIVTGLMFFQAAILIAMKRGVGVANLATMPTHPSAHIPPVTFCDDYAALFDLPPDAMLQMHARLREAFGGMMTDTLREWRAELGLPRNDEEDRTLAESRATPTLGIWSPHLIARPDDWPEYMDVGGAIYPDVDDLPELSAELTAFLQRDPRNPPVYLGWGSMPVGESKRLLPLIEDLVRHAPREMRFVVALDTFSDPCATEVTAEDLPALDGANGNGQAAEGNGKEEADDGGATLTRAEARAELARARAGDAAARVHFVKVCAHLRLFPQCAAVVTHCGAGSSAAALRAGRPVVPCPVVFDQAFWAQAMARAGVAAQPLPFAAASGRALAASINDALASPKIAAAARELGASVRAEGGARRAAEWIADLLQARKQAAETK